MIKKIISIIIGIFLLSIIPGVLANQDFSTNPTSISINLNKSENKDISFQIENIGSENISMDLSKVNLQNGSNTIALTLNQSEIINLTPQNTTSFKISFNSGTNIGKFIGSIYIENKDNSSNNQTIPIEVTVIEETQQSEETILFRDFSSILTMTLNVDDSSEAQSFYLVNNGTEIITDIEIKLDRLDGDNDEIDNDDIEINGEPADSTIDLNDLEGNNFAIAPGDDYKVKIDIDIPRNLDVDDYRGDLEIGYKINGVYHSRTFTLKVIAESDNDDVFFDSSIYVRNGVLEIVGEQGENIDDIEITLKNDASYDISDLELRVDGNLEEENSANTFSSSFISFNPNPVDVDERDEEDIDVEIDIPEDQAVGTYTTDLDLYSSSGKKLDTILLKIRVVGDIFISEINYEETLNPGDFMDLEVKVKNKGSQLYRNVKITGILYDIDSSNSNIIESTSNFILEVNGERSETLRFKIPEDASHGAHSFDIKVSYDSSEILEVKTLNIERPLHNIEIENYGISPSSIDCSGQMYSFMKVKNLGKYSESIKISTELTGTQIKKESSLFDLDVDENTQKNLILDISNLESGNYEVVQKVTYDGNLFIRKTSNLRYKSCNDVEDKVDIEPINETEDNIGNIDKEEKKDTIEFFGNEVEKTTIYLGSGLGFIVILIIISLFLL